MSLEEEINVNELIKPDKKEKEKYKSINLSDVKSIVHDIYTHWGISAIDLKFDKNFNDLKETVFDTYMTYMNRKKLKTEDKEYLNEVIETEIINRIENIEVVKSEDVIQHNIHILDNLDKIETPPQRSEGWYAFRRDRITASDFAVAIDKNPYAKKRDIILSKCGAGKKFNPGAAIAHGVKYEDVAVNIYENRNNVSISEYGCIPHPKYDFIGASPDGICNVSSKNRQYIGRMLEIKCPKSRKLNGQVPQYYFCQVQGQLEVCDLNECDFLECIIKEYDNVKDFEKDTYEFNDQKLAKINEIETYTIYDYLKQKNGMEKGVVIELYDYELEKSVFKYFFRNNNIRTLDDISIWESEIITMTLNDERYDYISTSYWKLKEYSCILVKRDREFWKVLLDGLTSLWNSVLYYRKEGIQSLLKEEKKETSKKNFGKEYEVAFLPDTDDENEDKDKNEDKNDNEIITTQQKIDKLLKSL